MASDLFAQVDALLKEGGQARPPVHLWNPALSGDIDIRIARDGAWYHEGTRFEREALVRLFASILKREGDEYFLVTPVEKWRIRVEDAPFIAVDAEVLGDGITQQLVFRTNLGDTVHAGGHHRLRVVHNADSGEPSPYVMVRDGLEARVGRNVFYRLVDRAVEHDGRVGLFSNGVFFPLD